MSKILFIFIFIFLSHSLNFDATYQKIKDVKKLKKEFTRIMLPIIQRQNAALPVSKRVPPSLALAQAAVESSWGRSRFVRVANNLYGEWTWGKKGIIPLRRDRGKTHKIKIFNTLDQSVKSYIHNLNTHRVYKTFREKRSYFGKNFDGIKAAKTLKYYSQIREKYVDLLIRIIKREHWLKYD